MRASSCRIEVLRSLEQLLACLSERQAPDALELAQHLLVPGLEILLELLRVRLPVGNPLLAPRELLRLRLELGLALMDPLLDLRHLQAAGLDLALDLGAQGDRLLARLDLSASRRVVSASRSASARIERRWSSARRNRDVLAVRSHAQRAAAPTAIPITAATAVSMDDPFDGLSRGGWPRLLTSGHRLHGGIPVNRSCCALYLGRCALRRAAVAPRGGGLGWERIVIVSGRFSGMRSVQVKCRMKLSYPTASGDQIRNERFEGRLGEPLRGEEAGRSWRRRRGRR